MLPLFLDCGGSGCGAGGRRKVGFIVPASFTQICISALLMWKDFALAICISIALNFMATNQVPATNASNKVHATPALTVIFVDSVSPRLAGCHFSTINSLPTPRQYQEQF